MNGQYILVYIIVGLALVYIVFRAIRKYKRIKKGNSPCEGCSSDCALRDMKRNRPGEQNECGTQHRRENNKGIL